MCFHKIQSETITQTFMLDTHPNRLCVSCSLSRSRVKTGSHQDYLQGYPRDVTFIPLSFISSPKTAIISSPSVSKKDPIRISRIRRFMFVIYSRIGSQVVFRVHSVQLGSLLIRGLFCQSSSWFHYVYPFVCIICL